MQIVIESLLALSGWEVFASLLGIAYVILAARESQWCWPFAFLSTFIYTLLFWDGNLPMQAILNFYYMAMAVYGYLLWRRHGNTESILLISSWSWSRQLLFLLFGSLISLIVGFYLENQLHSQNPYLDAGVIVFFHSQHMVNG